MKDKVNILGTEYEIILDDEYLDKHNLDGNHVVYEKKILLRSPDKYNAPDESIENMRKYFREVFRHEIIHAYFRLSGLEKYQQDEELVQWLAIQFPKIARTFSECGCAEE